MVRLKENEQLSIKRQMLSTYMLERYTLFVKFYNRRGGHKTYTAKASSFIDFFSICDQKWGRIPNYRTLNNNLSKSELEKSMPVLKWLSKTEQIESTPELEKIFSMQAAIQETMASFGKDVPLVLQAYLSYLNDKYSKNEILLKSIRGFLQPPMYLYHQLDIDYIETPSQRQIDKYLKYHKGSRSIINTFVRYLNKFHGTNLICKAIKRKKIFTPKIRESHSFVNDENRKVAESNLIELAMLPKPFSDSQKLSWINNGIRYFHRYMVDVRNLEDIIVQNNRESCKLMVVKYHELSFPLPKF